MPADAAGACTSIAEMVPPAATLILPRVEITCLYWAGPLGSPSVMASSSTMVIAPGAWAPREPTAVRRLIVDADVTRAPVAVTLALVASGSLEATLPVASSVTRPDTAEIVSTSRSPPAVSCTLPRVELTVAAVIAPAVATRMSFRAVTVWRASSVILVLSIAMLESRDEAESTDTSVSMSILPAVAVSEADDATMSAAASPVASRMFVAAVRTTEPLTPASTRLTEIAPPAVTETTPLLETRSPSAVPRVMSSASLTVMAAPVAEAMPRTVSTLVFTVAPLSEETTRSFVVTSPPDAGFELVIAPAFAAKTTADGAVTAASITRSFPRDASDTVSLFVLL